MGKRVQKPQLFFSKTSDFLEVYLPKQAFRSDNTQTSYRINLETFFNYLIKKNISPNDFAVTDCTYEFLLAYSQYLQESDYSVNTVNQKMATIKTYLKYIADCNLSYMQVYLAAKDVPTLKKIKKQAEFIEPDTLKAFLDSPKNTMFGNRDRLVLILLFDLGIRVSELTAIKLGDITFKRTKTEIKIHGKGRKERRLLLSEKAAEHLKQYIQISHTDTTDPKRYLFYSKSRGPYVEMTTRNIQRIVKKYGDKMKETDPDIPTMHPHLLRHTRATYLSRDGVPLNMISTLLGHEQIETTRVYVTTSAEQIREAIDNVSDEAYGTADAEPLMWRGHEDELKKKFGLK